MRQMTYKLLSTLCLMSLSNNIVASGAQTAMGAFNRPLINVLEHLGVRKPPATGEQEVELLSPQQLLRHQKKCWKGCMAKRKQWQTISMMKKTSCARIGVLPGSCGVQADPEFTVSNSDTVTQQCDTCTAGHGIRRSGRIMLSGTGREQKRQQQSSISPRSMHSRYCIAAPMTAVASVAVVLKKLLIFGGRYGATCVHSTNLYAQKSLPCQVRNF